MKYHYIELKNGLRSVFRQSVSPVSHVGLITAAGSRDEEENEHGLAHFIEHMVFKGTRKRKAGQILSYIDGIGGELNAFTTREETCLHASVPVKYTERAADLLADVFSGGIFSEKEIEREKEVIIDEIMSYSDMPDESVLEEFEERIFAGHPLGRKTQGSETSVRSFTRNDIISFLLKNYTASTTIVSCTASITPQKWQAIFEKHFGHLELPSGPAKRKKFTGQNQFHHIDKKKIYQSHLVMGRQAYDITDSRRTGLTLLNNLLGGPANNSLLNLSVREKNGLSYHIESNYHPYMDTGIFLIYLGADSRNLDRAITLTKKELDKLCRTELSTIQLKKAQRQLIGQLTVSYESMLSEMLSIGKSYLVRGSVYSMEQAIRDIENLRPAELLEIANEIFDERHLSSLIYQANGS